MTFFAGLVGIGLALLVAPSSRQTESEKRAEAGAVWEVREPQEISAYFAFPTASVADRLPAGLRFVTLGDIGPRWRVVRQHLEQYPQHAGYGMSFVAIVRAARISLAGRSPVLSRDAGLAQWWAYVARADASGDVSMSSVVTLGTWVSDASFATFMQSHGYYAERGDARLQQGDDGVWRGTLDVGGLRVSAACRAASAARELAGGALALHAPRNAGLADIIDLSFTQYVERPCDADVPWTIDGRHALSQAVQVGPSSFLYEFDMSGRARRP